MLTFVGGMVFCFVNLLFKGLCDQFQIIADGQTLGAYLLTQTAFDTFTARFIKYTHSSLHHSPHPF